MADEKQNSPPNTESAAAFEKFLVPDPPPITLKAQKPINYEVLSKTIKIDI